MFTWKNALVAVFAFASQASFLGLAHGQDYLTVPVAKTATGETAKVAGMLKGKESVDPAPIKRYVQNEFARLTNPADTASYATIRTSLLGNIRKWQCRSGEEGGRGSSYHDRQSCFSKCQVSSARTRECDACAC